MRLAGVLIGPAILAFAIVTGLSYLVPETSPEPLTAPTGLAWSGRVFKDRVEFARWLQVRGVSYEQWSRLHPGSPWAAPRRAEPASASAPRTLTASSTARDWDSVVVAALGAALVLISGLLAIGCVVLVRMKRTVDRFAEPSLLAPRPAPVSSENGASSPAQAPPLLIGAGGAARREIESAKPRIESARLAARRTVEVARPRLQSAGLAARQGVGTAVAQTAELGHELRYAIATERLRVAFFYIFAALLSTVIGLATAILV